MKYAVKRELWCSFVVCLNCCVSYLKVPVRTTSRSPVLSRRDSPLQGSGQQTSQAGQRNSTR